MIFTENDWKDNRINGARTHLLTFPSRNQLRRATGALKYIQYGEEQDIDKGYKCRIRDEWQIVPSLRVSEALFIRRNNKYPKLIINQAHAYTTDTMHRVTVNPTINIEAFTASYYNSLSLAFTEICGRSHGGGVLELMPNEAERVLLPYHEDNNTLLPVIDRMVREGKNMSDILEITNKQILTKNYGLSKADVKMADRIWEKLSLRRLNRSN